MLRTGALLLVLLLAVPHLCPAEEGAAAPGEEGAPGAAARAVEALVTDGIYLLTAPLRLDRETAVLAGGLTLGLAGLILADREIRERVQTATGPTGRDVAHGATRAGDGWVVVGVNGALLTLGLLPRSRPRARPGSGMRASSPWRPTSSRPS